MDREYDTNEKTIKLYSLKKYEYWLLIIGHWFFGQDLDKYLALRLGTRVPVKVVHVLFVNIPAVKGMASVYDTCIVAPQHISRELVS